MCIHGTMFPVTNTQAGKCTNVSYSTHILPWCTCRLIDNSQAHITILFVLVCFILQRERTWSQDSLRRLLRVWTRDRQRKRVKMLPHHPHPRLRTGECVCVCVCVSCEVVNIKSFSTPTSLKDSQSDANSSTSDKAGTSSSDDKSHDIKPPTSTRQLSTGISSQLHNRNSPLKINTSSNIPRPAPEPPTQNLSSSRSSNGESGQFVPVGPTGHSVSPPMAMLSPYMVDHMKGSDNMSLSRYVELMTLV